MSGSGAGGRPTGQQVAVMLAQQQLSSVVRWCRRRMVWEVLLVQLAAVGAAFEELCSPDAPCQRVRVTRVAGTALPCPIARRPGLAPARVGPACLELELGPDALAGQVTARLWGRFLCSPVCEPVVANRAVGGAGAGGSIGAAAAVAATHGFVLSDEDAPGTVPYAGRGDGGAAGGGGGGRGAPLLCLRRQYCLERGDSALTIVQEVAAVIRMQTLLARLEMTARPAAAATAGTGAGPVLPQRLSVLTRPTAAAAEAVPQPGPRPLQPHNSQEEGVSLAPPAKRLKSEPRVLGDGCDVPMSNGTQPNGGALTAVVDAQAPAQAPAAGAAATTSAATTGTATRGGCGLRWHWPLVGTLTLEHYSCSAAAIRYTPAAGAAGAPGGGGAGEAPAADAATSAIMPPAPLVLHITWAPRDVRGIHGGGGGAAAAAAAPPQTPGAQGGGAAAALFGPLASASVPAGVPAPLANTPSSSTAPHAHQYHHAAHAHHAAAHLHGRGSPLLPPEAVATSSRPVQARAGEPFGTAFCDLVLCTVTCSSGHSLPSEYLHVLEVGGGRGDKPGLLWSGGRGGQGQVWWWDTGLPG